MDCNSRHVTKKTLLRNIKRITNCYFTSCALISSNSNCLPSQGNDCYLGQSRQSLLNKLNAPEFKIMTGITILCS
jgi:hypothetical protein